MTRTATLGLLIAGLGFTSAAAAQDWWEDDYGWYGDEYETGYYDDYGYDTGYYGDVGGYGDIYGDTGFYEDDYGMYVGDYDWDTDEGWFNDWYGDAENDWDWF